jgi:hypothetical protein
LSSRVDSDSVEIVPPVRDLALAEREDGDLPVGLPTPSVDNVAVGGVLEHHDALGHVVVNGQIRAEHAVAPDGVDAALDVVGSGVLPNSSSSRAARSTS